jgi:hypothetical protein
MLSKKTDPGQIIETALMGALILAKEIFKGLWYFLFRPAQLGVSLRDRSGDDPGSARPLTFLVVAWLVSIWANREILVPVDRWFGDPWYNQVSSFILISPPSLT